MFMKMKVSLVTMFKRTRDMMLSKVFDIYAYVFGGIFFFKFNKFIYSLSLRGMGILNYKNDYLVGEKIWLTKYLEGNQTRL